MRPGRLQIGPSIRKHGLIKEQNHTYLRRDLILIFVVVTVLRSGISILFLSLYLVRFAHALTPHCDVNCDQSEGVVNSHNHEHHQCSSELIATECHDHVHHTDHFDEDWLDYLVCLQSDIKHDHEGCHASHMPTPESITSILSRKSDVKTHIPTPQFFPDYLLIGERLVQTSNRGNGPPTFASFDAFLISFSFRGPPIYSC